MPRKSSGYPRPAYTRSAAYGRAGSHARSNLTRRSLLGAAGFVSGLGVLEFFRIGHHGAPQVVKGGGPRPGIAKPAGSASQSRPVTSPGGGAGSSTPGLPTGHGRTHGTGDSPPPHHGGGGSGHPGGKGPHGHGKGAGPAHGGSSSAQLRRQERVTLPPAKVRERSRPIYSVADIDPNPPKRAIALTIDDGPDPAWTPKVLRLLDKHHMQASFCVVGIHADSYPNLIRDIHRAGHVIVNHSYTHVQPFNHQTEKRIVAEITRTQRAIEKATKVTPELFRAPGGGWSTFVYRAVAAYGLTPLDWDVDPMDWATPGTKKIERAMLKGRPGDIVLCHDGGGNRSETVKALRKVLPAWKRRGYTTIPLILPSSAKRLRHPASPPPSRSPSSGPSDSPSPSSTP